MSTSYPTRNRRAPRRFDPEDFVPGANNKHTVGRKIDAGHEVCSESEEHQWCRENMLREEEAPWLEESEEEPELGTESEEEEEALSDSEEEESDSEEEESEWSDEDDDDEEWQQLEQAQQLEVAQLVAQVMAGARPEEA